jgi:hypothetical protein
MAKSRNPIRPAASKAKSLALRAAERLARPVDDVNSPVFVCGCSHSGTTLTARILGHHPDLWIVPHETSLFTRTPTPKRVRMFNEQWTAEALNAGAKSWAEKTPNHIFHVDRILRYFPQCRIVIVERDGRDVAASYAVRAGSVEIAVSKWVRAVDARRGLEERPQVAVLRYEDLVDKPEIAVRELCERIEIPFALEMLHVSPNWEWKSQSLKTADSSHFQRRAYQVRQPIFDGRGRWKELSPDDLEKVLSLAGPALVQAGYIDHCWESPEDQ